jgi:hypothetical protein
MGASYTSLVVDAKSFTLTGGSQSLALGLTLVTAPQLGECLGLMSWLPLNRHHGELSILVPSLRQRLRQNPFHYRIAPRFVGLPIWFN